MNGPFSTRLCRTFLITVALSGLTACPSARPGIALNTVMQCNNNPQVVAACDDPANAAKDVVVCVVFDSNGCIELQPSTNPPQPQVLPYQAHACYQDDLTFTAVRRQNTQFVSSNDKFQVFFMPLGRVFGATLTGESSNNLHSRNVYRQAVSTTYKYTIIGGPASCSYREFDPRIKIDPR